jgi:hypothetical protein
LQRAEFSLRCATGAASSVRDALRYARLQVGEGEEGDPLDLFTKKRPRREKDKAKLDGAASRIK